MVEKLDIERDDELRIHKRGTLKSITRWVNTHETGIAEWLKNTRRAYFPDRANVQSMHWGGVLLLNDKNLHGDSRIGFLDVGGLTNEDVEKWSVWQDPEASERAQTKERIEETQGNGGKAYMYNLFTGTARLIGVKNGLKNCKGFVGELGTEERGIPGYIPNREKGQNTSVEFIDELAQVLKPYGLTFHDLPGEIREALTQRKAFTLVEGVLPKRYENSIPSQDILEKIIKQSQALLPLEQLNIYAYHNANILNKGKPLKIDPLPPYKGFDSPREIEIPESLPDEKSIVQSTTFGGKKRKGILTLKTSQKDISKRLKHRWNITYRTSQEVVGKISVSEILPPGVPASQYIYGELELDALSPDYVDLGRIRPNDGPLLEALNIFIAEKIKDLAGEINVKRVQQLNEEDLDEIHSENTFLDRWKNKFFGDIIDSITSGPSIGGLEPGQGNEGKPKKRKKRGATDTGNIPYSIELGMKKDKLIMGRGVRFHLSSIVRPVVKDGEGNVVYNANFSWWSEKPGIANFSMFSDEINVFRKGACNIFVGINGTDVKAQIPLEVWEVDHVLLTPRKLKIPLGTRKRIIAEVTSDDAQRSTDVLLEWKHEAIDQLIVRISPMGWITGNRIGQTTVFAGAGDVMARIGAEVEVISNPDLRNKGEGFPKLLLTDKDTDPETGKKREGDPDKPPLWQEVTDVQHNIWWLNMQNPQVADIFNYGASSPMWRMYHAEKIVEMFVQAIMKMEFTQKGDEEEPRVWYDHLYLMEDYLATAIQTMWENLKEYVEHGKSALK
mgnify:CR=1 FL=1